MSTPTKTTASRTKIARLDLYNRERDKLKDQILQFNLFFKFKDKQVNPTNCGCLMASYLRGHATTQIKLYLRKYINASNFNKDINKIFEDYKTFKNYLQGQFRIINKESRADHAI